MGVCPVIRNSVTLYENDAWTVVSAIENLIDFIEEYEPDSRLNRNYKEELIELKDRIEHAIR